MRQFGDHQLPDDLLLASSVADVFQHYRVAIRRGHCDVRDAEEGLREILALCNITDVYQWDAANRLLKSACLSLDILGCNCVACLSQSRMGGDEERKRTARQHNDRIPGTDFEAVVNRQYEDGAPCSQKARCNRA